MSNSKSILKQPSNKSYYYLSLYHSENHRLIYIKVSKEMENMLIKEDETSPQKIIGISYLPFKLFGMEYKFTFCTDKMYDNINDIQFYIRDRKDTTFENTMPQGGICLNLQEDKYTIYEKRCKDIINDIINLLMFGRKVKDENPREQITFIAESSGSDESDTDNTDETDNTDNTDDTDYIENEFAIDMRKKVYNRFEKYFKYSRNKKNTYDADMLFKLVSPYKTGSKFKSNLVKKIIKNILEDIDVSYDKTANVFTNVKCLY